MEKQGVTVDQFRAVDFALAPGVYPDMREHGAMADDWPELYERVQAADILVLGSPIWLGEKSSVCTRVIERLYGNSSELNEAGQYAYYGKVGGCLITGNEDGIKHCSMNIGTSFTSPVSSKTPAESRRTETSARCGTEAPASTSRTRSTASRTVP